MAQKGAGKVDLICKRCGKESNGHKILIGSERGGKLCVSVGPVDAYHEDTCPYHKRNDGRTKKGGPGSREGWKQATNTVIMKDRKKKTVVQDAGNDPVETGFKVVKVIIFE